MGVSLERKTFKINKMIRKLEVKSWKGFKHYKKLLTKIGKLCTF